MKVNRNGAGRKGLAKVRLAKDTVQIWLDGEKGDPIEIDRENAPETLVKGGRYFINLSADEDEIRQIRPADAMVRVKFNRFYSREGEVPAPYAEPEKSGISKNNHKPYKIPAHLSMTPILRITEEGDYKGMEVPYRTVYPFIEGEDNMTEMDGSGKSFEEAVTFLTVTGAIEEDIPYSENLLGKLAKRMQKKNREFLCALRNGYVEYLAESPDADEPQSGDEPEEDEKETAHATGKNGKATPPVDDDDDEQPAAKKPALDGRRYSEDADDEPSKAKKPAKKVPSDDEGEELAKFFDDEDE